MVTAALHKVDLPLLIHQLSSCLLRLRLKYFVSDLIFYVGFIGQNEIVSLQSIRG